MTLFITDSKNVFGKSVSEAGSYNVRILEDSEHKLTNNTFNDMAVLNYEVVDGKYAGGKILYNNIVWDKKDVELSAKRFNTLLAAIGVPDGTPNVTNVEQAPKTDLTSHTSNKTNPHGVTKSQVGLGNVSNVEQASKTEFNSHVADKTNPHSVTKAQVNLGNVDNYATANQTDAEQGLAGNKFITPMGVKQHVDKRIATQEEVNAGEARDKIVSPKTLDKKLDDLNVSGGFGAFNMSVFNGEQGQITGSGIHGKEVKSGTQVLHMRPDDPVAERASNGRIKIQKAGTYLFIIHTWYQIGTQTNGYLYFNLLKNGSRAGNNDRVTGQGVDALKNRWDGTGQCVNTANAGDEFSAGIETNITGSFTSVGTKTITVIKLA